MKLEITKNLVESAMECVQEKIKVLNELIEETKRLSFDSFGRAIIGEVNILNEEFVDSELYTNGYDEFFKYFREYCTEKNFRSILDDNYEVFSSRICRIYDVPRKAFMNNSITFMTNDNKKVTMKMSKVLNALNSKWTAVHPEYTMIDNRIKELRAERKSYEDREFSCLMEDKKYFEQTNLNIIYGNFLNAIKGTQKIYLTLNPLDILTASGNSYGDAENPTKFNSCWSTDFRLENDVWTVRGDDHYSHLLGQWKIANILNRGMIYIPNGKTLETEFFTFLGYKERGHFWADEKKGWLENIYPCKSINRRNAIIEVIEKNIPMLSTNEVRYDIEFSYNDTEGIEEYLSIRDRNYAFLDNVGIDRNSCTMYKLYTGRGNRNYDFNDLYPCEDEDDRCYCDHCENMVHQDDICTAYHYGREVFVCSDCLDSDYVRCDDCGEYHHREDINDINYRDVCNGCADEYGVCDHCGETFHYDDLEDGLCSSCQEEEESA